MPKIEVDPERYRSRWRNTSCEPAEFAHGTALLFILMRSYANHRTPIDRPESELEKIPSM